eukprot:Selendium_serpulae@DN1867_c0_g1_i1.p1
MTRRALCPQQSFRGFCFGNTSTFQKTYLTPKWKSTQNTLGTSVRWRSAWITQCIEMRFMSATKQNAADETLIKSSEEAAGGTRPQAKSGGSPSPQIPTRMKEEEPLSWLPDPSLQEPRRPMKPATVVFLCGSSLILCGYAYAYALEKKLTFKQFCKAMVEKANGHIERAGDYFSSCVDKYFPLGNEPLLPDAADIQLPDGVPTLIVNLQNVVMHLDKESPEGRKLIKRPGADRFFTELMYMFEIVIWSSDEYPSAAEIAERWGLYKIASGVLHREQCDKVDGRFVKNLDRLGRKLDRVVILDCDPNSYLLHPQNGIHIRPFHGEPGDTDLENLTSFLKMVASSQDDVRKTLARFGGGDVDLSRRWNEYQEKQKLKANSRRSIGKAFMSTQGTKKPPSF